MFTSLVSTLLFASAGAAAALPALDLTAGGLLAPITKRAGCENTADSRDCWGDYDISTNYYHTVPDTGVTREYYFNIINTTAAPDGVERLVLAINGSIPGPTIIADWGDAVVVHVTNSMETNGTSIHWHGVRQLNTNQQDGVTSVTQCPIAPGDTMTYTWRAVQYGSSWYHSHYYVQAWDGVAGGIIINGPATADYDEDLGNLLLSDWDHETADVLMARSLLIGPPTLATGLMNGTNTWEGGGHRFSTTIETGKRYRLRLVNVAADSVFKFTVDGHTMEVIQTDFVPIVPYSTDVVSITMGQRYDVIITANATAGNYWMRAIIQSACSNSANPDSVLGIWNYDGVTLGEPTTSAADAAAVDDCLDEDMAKLVPYLAIAAEDDSDSDDFSVQLTTRNGFTVWEMGSESFASLYNYPTVLHAAEGNATWTGEENVFEFAQADEWVCWVIQTKLTVAHPIHMHGHDFWVVAQGTGTFDLSTSQADLQLANAPRRDTVQLPPAGYVVLAFVTDNPGAWVVHCHIAWHTIEGLAVQMIEREAEFVAGMDADAVNSTCKAWDSWATEHKLVQTDSGI